VLRRLSPLLPDPTLPRFPMRGRPVSVPAPRAAAIRLPVPRAERSPRPPSRQIRAAPPGAPLAADPGPLPAGAAAVPSRRPAGRGRSVRTLASVVLLVLVVLVGVAAGWTLTRLLAGQSPLAGPAEAPAPGVELITHADPAGFTVPVPQGWPEVEGTAGSPAANPVARFTSQDGAAALTIDRLNGNRTDPEGFAATLTARRLGVDRVRIEEPLHAVPGRQFELRYRTDSADGQRLVWVRIVPRAADLWVLRLAAPPGASDPDPAALFGRIADGFRPA
jgi:hypothetical protein